MPRKSKGPRRPKMPKTPKRSVRKPQRVSKKAKSASDKLLEYMTMHTNPYLSDHTNVATRIYQQNLREAMFAGAAPQILVEDCPSFQNGQWRHGYAGGVLTQRPSMYNTPRAQTKAMRSLRDVHQDHRVAHAIATMKLAMQEKDDEARDGVDDDEESGMKKPFDPFAQFSAYEHSHLKAKDCRV